ncbi:MAG: hypothetical protein AAFU55_03545 [Pseudomonadota bacterium]
MIPQILEITAPVFILAAIGYGWARSGLPYDIPFVTRLAMMWAIPALIFTTLVRAEIDPAALGATLDALDEVLIERARFVEEGPDELFGEDRRFPVKARGLHRFEGFRWY